ncbi:MAG: hypothetical protein NT086_11135 [Proteobacteria bacterium]|nr:hypothetical protein [Pseudomonadota bacterium]
MMPAVFEPLPIAWVERVFLRLRGRFGRSFVEKFQSGVVNEFDEDAGVVEAMLVWADELAGLDGVAITRGLAASYAYPPSCDQFKAACMGADAGESVEQAFWHAQAQYVLRLRHAPEAWRSPRHFHAARRLGRELVEFGYRVLAGRWMEAWQAALADADVPIPSFDPAFSLEHKKMTLSKEEAAQQVALLKEMNIGRCATSWASEVRQADNAVMIEMRVGALRNKGMDVPVGIRNLGVQMGLGAKLGLE